MSERDLQVRAAKGMAGQLEESPTVTRLREKVNEQEQEIRSWRILTGVLFSGANLIMEADRIMDTQGDPIIDFLNDSPEEIREKIMARADHNIPN